MLALSAVLALLATSPTAKSLAADACQPPAAKAKSSPASIAALVKQLDDDRFSRREEASSRLEEAGVAAVDGLRGAAVGQSLEASTRAFAILKTFLAGNDSAASAAARAALQAVAAEHDAAEKQGNDSLVAATARARGILDQLANATASPTPNPRRWNLVRGIPLQVGGFGGAGQVNVVQGNAIGRSVMTMHMANGSRRIQVEENKGDGQKLSLKIVSDPQAGITMDVVTTVNGKEKTEKYQARDADTLRKEHPEAFKLYQQYGGGDAGAVRIGGGQLQRQAGRIVVGGAVPAAAGGQIGTQLDQLRDLARQMQKLNRQFEPEATRQRIEEAKKRIEDLRRQPPQDRAVPAEK